LNPRIFLSGSKGFLGSHLSALLDKEEVNWRGLERPAGLTWRDNPQQFSELVSAQIVEFEPTHIINLANHFTRGFPTSEIDKSLEANVALPLLLARAAEKSSVRFLHAGSYWQLPYYSEKLEYQSQYLYTKHLASRLLQNFKGSPASICEVLLTDTFGANDARDKLIPRALDSKKQGAVLKVSNPSAQIYLSSSIGVSEALLKLLVGSSAPGYIQGIVMPSLEFSVSQLLDVMDVQWSATDDVTGPTTQSSLGSQVSSELIRLVPETSEQAMSRLLYLSEVLG
jgi:nucleoside-diphosphate-sugar epimerase